MAEYDPDDARHRATYIEAMKRRRGDIVPDSLKFGDPGGTGRRITPVANRD
jgi:hypothetical protein